MVVAVVVGANTTTTLTLVMLLEVLECIIRFISILHLL